MWIKVDKPENVPQVIATIDEGFANSSAETLSESEAAFIGSFLEQYRMFFRMAELLGFIVVLTIGLVAANTAAMSIRERRGEIAVMRSMGFPSRTILSLLLAESLLIGLIGGVIGCGSAYVVLKVFSIGNVGGPLGTIRMPPVMLVETLVVAALIGLFSAMVPASSAARQEYCGCVEDGCVRRILISTLSLSEERVRERCSARRRHHFQAFGIEYGSTAMSALYLSRRHRYAAFADLSSDKERLGQERETEILELDGDTAEI